LDGAVPASVRAGGPLVVRRARLTVSAAAIVTGALVWTAIAQMLDGIRGLGLLAGAMAITTAILSVSLLRAGMLQRASYAVVTLLGGFGTAVLALTGVEAVTGVMFLGMTPLAAVLLTGKRAGIAFTSATVVTILALWFLRDALGPVLGPDLAPLQLTVFRSTMLLTLCSFAAAFVFESGKDAALRALEQAQLGTDRANRARLQEEGRFRALIERSLDGFMVFDARGKVVYHSPSIERLGSLPPGGLPVDVTDAFHPSARQALRETFERCAANPGSHVPFRVRVAGSDGGWRWMEGSGHNLLEDPEIGGIVVTVRDVTERENSEAERRRLEQRVNEGERLRSLGVLAGGIAHDFNNLLVAIRGNAELLLGRAGTTGEEREMLEEIEDAAGRSADLTHKLLAYAGEGRAELSTLDLGSLLQEVERLTKRRLPEGATLRVESEGRTPWVHADVAQLHQVVMNLVVNATEALDLQGGEILLRSGITPVDQKLLERCRIPYELADGDYAYVEVRDNGSGMTAETLDHLFDPFFSTKFRGRGLGLAALLGILRRHRGNLWVESAEGVGSIFCVLLPLTAPPAEDTRPVPDSAEASDAGVVLVVDDESQVRTVISKMLQRAGFAPISCATGQEALDHLDAGTENVVAIVLDLEMPGMHGTETFAALRGRRPELPVLIASGHGELDFEERMGEAERIDFIRKPFTADALADKLRALRS
jgi:PAS domain S-box-containing protein